LELTGSKRNSMENFFFRSSDGGLELHFRTQKTVKYSESFEIGIKKIREWMGGKLKKADKAIVMIVEGLLKKNRQGEYKAENLIQLISLKREIHDQLFHEGCEIIEQSVKAGESKGYFQFKERDPESNELKTITLNFSAL